MDLDDVIAKLKTERDELRVRLHLMKAEARDEFEELEDKWSHLEARLDVTAGEAKESLAEVRAAAGRLADEIGNAYQRIKKSL